MPHLLREGQGANEHCLERGSGMSEAGRKNGKENSRELWKKDDIHQVFVLRRSLSLCSHNVETHCQRDFTAKINLCYHGKSYGTEQTCEKKLHTGTQERTRAHAHTKSTKTQPSAHCRGEQECEGGHNEIIRTKYCATPATTVLKTEGLCVVCVVCVSV